MMIDLQNRSHPPTLDAFGEAIGNPLFRTLSDTLCTTFRCTPKTDFSRCSMEPGWNVKFKRSGRTLCTVYPRESFFTAMVVVDRKEKAAVEALLPECTLELQALYAQTREGNGQRWLMIDLEDPGPLYDNLMRLLRIRAGG